MTSRGCRLNELGLEFRSDDKAPFLPKETVFRPLPELWQVTLPVAFNGLSVLSHGSADRGAVTVGSIGHDCSISSSFLHHFASISTSFLRTLRLAQWALGELFFFGQGSKFLFKLFELLFPFSKSRSLPPAKREYPLAILFRSLLILSNQSGYLLPRRSGSSYWQVAGLSLFLLLQLYLHSAFFHHKELVLLKGRKGLWRRIPSDHKIKPVERSDIEILSPVCRLSLLISKVWQLMQFGHFLPTPFRCYRVEFVAILILLYTALVQIPVAENGLSVPCFRPPSTTSSNRLREDDLLGMNARCLCKAGTLLLQLCLFQQVGISGKDGDVFEKVHPRLTRPYSLIDGMAAHTVVFELFDEELLIVQQVKFIAVERLLHPHRS